LHAPAGTVTARVEQLASEGPGLIVLSRPVITEKPLPRWQMLL
jgi:hypothetical protein